MPTEQLARGQAAALDAVAGDPCGEDGCHGAYRRDEYKGNNAAVCEACGTPGVVVW